VWSVIERILFFSFTPLLPSESRSFADRRTCEMWTQTWMGSAVNPESTETHE
jgi:hypothetical protein